MAISADMVKELREKTGVGFMECKSALTESGGDMEEAVTILRKRGLASLAKKSSRDAKDGLVDCATDGKSGLLLEVNCETDFVARNPEFQALVKDIAAHVEEKQPASVEDLLKQPFAKEPSVTVQDAVATLIQKIGENIQVRRFVRYQLDAKGGLVGSYIHNGKIGVMLEVNGADGGDAEFQAMVKDVAMHIAASDPRFIRKEDVTEDVLAKEREIYLEQARQTGKPENVLAKIVEGRMSKYYAEACLLEQPFVKDPNLTVQGYIAALGKKLGATIQVSRFVRYKLGGE